MPYKLYTDKQEVFECEVAVKNASLKNSVARLVVESENLDLVFKGKINDGKCIVPIRKLKGILDENTKGNMSLEVIVEDTYFKPWEGSHNLSIVGNVYTREEGDSPFVNTDGFWKINIINKVSSIVSTVQVSTTDTGSIPTAEQIAAAVWNKLIPNNPDTGSYGEHVAGRLLTIAHYLGMK